MYPKERKWIVSLCIVKVKLVLISGIGNRVIVKLAGFFHCSIMRIVINIDLQILTHLWFFCHLKSMLLYFQRISPHKMKWWIPWNSIKTKLVTYDIDSHGVTVTELVYGQLHNWARFLLQLCQLPPAIDRPGCVVCSFWCHWQTEGCDADPMLRM